MNEYMKIVGSDEVVNKAIELTINRVDKVYEGFKNKGYNNDTAADFAKELIRSIYNETSDYVTNTFYNKYNSERGRDDI